MADSSSLPPLPARETWPGELAQEHAHTRSFLTRLGSICDAPPGQTSCDQCRPLAEAKCHRRFAPLLDEVAGFIFMHFIAEERMMKSAEYPAHAPQAHASHVEDHANLCEVLFQVITDVDTAAAVLLVRRLETLLERIIHEHIPQFDAPFVRRLQVV